MSVIEIIISVVTAISFALCVVLVIVVLDKFRKTKMSLSKYGQIESKRSEMEEDLYEIADVLNSESTRFVDANRLLLTYPNSKCALSVVSRNDSFFNNLGIFPPKEVVIPYQVMCLMPFHKKFDNRYKAIQRGCELAGFVCKRSDYEDATGFVLKHIVSLILQSQVVVAMLDGRNANVFYEIGIAHSLGKPVLLLVQNNSYDQVPFDMSSNYIILYKDLDDLKMKLYSKLKNIAQK